MSDDDIEDDVGLLAQDKEEEKAMAEHKQEMHRSGILPREIMQVVELEDAAGQDGKKPRSLVLIAALISATGGILFGYDIGIISGALLQLKVDFSLSCLEQEYVVASMLFGAIMASLSGGFCVDFIGRRMTVILNAGVFLVGAGILAAAPSYAILLSGRVVVGFAVALSVIAECVYISEISPSKRRGFLVSLNEIGIVSGFLVAYLVNFAFINVEHGWRWMFGLSGIPAIFQGIGMIFLPPSPRYLLIKGKEAQARLVLARLFGAARVDLEIEDIKRAVRDERSRGVLDLCRDTDNMRHRMAIGCGLVFLQQFTGQPNVMYYAPTIFQSLGFHSDSAATLATVGLGSAKLMFALIALVLLDRVGRRILLLSGSAIMSLCLLCLGIATLLNHDQNFRNPCDIIAPFQNSTPSIILSNSTLAPDLSTALEFKASTMAALLSTIKATSVIDEKPTSVSDDLITVASNIDAETMTSEITADVGTEAPNLNFNMSENNPKNPSEGNSNIETTQQNNSLNVSETDSQNVSGESLRIRRDVTEDEENEEKEGEQENPALKWLSLLALFGYVGGYEIGFGLGTWLVLSEIFPAAVRGRAIAIATVLNWGTNLVVSFTFLDLLDAVGMSGILLPYAAVCVLSMLFIYYLIPETKGKTLEQISESLKNRHTSRRCCLLSCCQREEHSPLLQRDNEEDGSPLNSPTN